MDGNNNGTQWHFSNAITRLGADKLKTESNYQRLEGKILLRRRLIRRSDNRHYQGRELYILEEVVRIMGVPWEIKKEKEVDDFLVRSARH